MSGEGEFGRGGAGGVGGRSPAIDIAPRQTRPTNSAAIFDDEGRKPISCSQIPLRILTQLNRVDPSFNSVARRLGFGKDRRIKLPFV